MIKKNKISYDEILEATCDCCGKQLKLDLLGRVEDHMTIGGYQNGKILEAVVCVPCMTEKLTFITIAKRDSTIGNC